MTVTYPAPLKKVLYQGRTLKEWIPDIVNNLVAAVDPVQIYVFGSVARDEDGPDSDLDILIVVDTFEETPKRQVWSKAYEAIDIDIPRDLLVTDLPRFWFNKQRSWHIEHIAAATGILVYDREPRIPKETYMNPPPVDDEADALYWLTKARNDLYWSKQMSATDLDNALYHAQQAAEKALKALIISDGKGSKKTHDLNKLAAVLPERYSLLFNTDITNQKDLEDLSAWEVEGRYPATPPEDFTDDDANRLFALAAHIVERVGLALDAQGTNDQAVDPPIPEL